MVAQKAEETQPVPVEDIETGEDVKTKSNKRLVNLLAGKLGVDAKSGDEKLNPEELSMTMI